MCLPGLFKLYEIHVYHRASGRTPQFSEALRQARLPTHKNPVAVHPGGSRVQEWLVAPRRPEAALGWHSGPPLPTWGPGPLLPHLHTGGMNEQKCRVLLSGAEEFTRVKSRDEPWKVRLWSDANAMIPASRTRPTTGTAQALPGRQRQMVLCSPHPAAFSRR